MIKRGVYMLIRACTLDRSNVVYKKIVLVFIYIAVYSLMMTLPCFLTLRGGSLISLTEVTQQSLEYC